MSRLDEIRNKLRSQIREETDSALNDVKKGPVSTFNRGQPSVSSTQHTSEMSSRELNRNLTDHEQLSSGYQDIDFPLRPQPNKRALFIGNNAYEYGTELDKAVNDARSMQKFFADIGYKVIYDYDQPRDGMQKALDRFKEDIQPGDELVIGFSGHGFQINSEIYLCPTDAGSGGKIYSQGINLQKEMDDMRNCGARMVLAIVDACRHQTRVDLEELFNEGFFEGVQEGVELVEVFASPQEKNQKLKSQNPVSRDQATQGFAIVFATSHGTSAWEHAGMDNGVFTHYFLKEARVRGRTIQQVIDRVRDQVQDATNHKQSPAFNDNLNGKYYFF